MITASNGSSEFWLPVKRWNGKYEVSTFGAVRNSATGRHLKAAANNRGGYLQVFAWIDGKTVGANVHRLVAETFLQNSDGLPCVNHKNGDRLDARVENLEWCTHQQNTRHAIDVLRLNFSSNLMTGKGEESGAHRLTEVEVRSIKRLLEKGVALVDIAGRFDTCPTNIGSIKRGLTWSHVK